MHDMTHMDEALTFVAKGWDPSMRDEHAMTYCHCNAVSPVNVRLYGALCIWHFYTLDGCLNICIIIIILLPCFGFGKDCILSTDI